MLVDVDQMTEALKVTSFFVGTFSSTAWQDVYTVPAGKRITLKMVTEQVSVSTSGFLHLAVKRGGTQYFVAGVSYPTNGFGAQWEGWVVLNAGDIVQVKSDSSAATYWTVSGYLYYV